MVVALACKPGLAGTFCIFRHLKIISKGHCAGGNEKAHLGFHFAIVAGFLFSQKKAFLTAVSLALFLSFQSEFMSLQ